MKVGSISGSLTRLVDNTSYLIEGANITITTGSNGAITISSTGGGGGSGDAYFDSTTAGSIFTSGSAAFVGNQDEWNVIDSPADKGTDVFFYVSGSIGSKDGPTPGASLFSGDVVVSGSFFSEGNTLEVTGTVLAVHGFSGSLTNLTDGSSYLIAGNNITIVTQSNGSVVISSTASGTGDSYFDSTVAGSIFTTGSAAFVDQESVTSPADKGTDVFFYVSGSIGSKDGPTPGVALFGGDVVVSGSMFASGDRLEMSGTLLVTEGISGSLTTLTDGTSYLIAGNNISIVSQSNGSILISNTFSQVDDFFDSTTAGSIFTTGSAAFVGQESIDSPADKGTDVFFYVSGSIGSKDGSTPGIALFGGDVIISGSMFAEGNRFEMSGTLLVTEGISGSLTTLVDGTSYLVAGDNISIVSQSNGSILISNTFVQVDDFFDSTTAGSIFTTGSAAFKNQESIDSPADKGTDVFFYVSGSIGSKDGPTPGVALFSGDVVVSGSMFTQGDVLEVTGTLIVTNGISGSLTTLSDGTSYLIAGNNISIVTQSNGSILISNTFSQVDDFFDSTTAGSIFTSGSSAFVGSGNEWGVIDSPADKGSDVFFYVSGSIAGNGNEDKKSLFGGDTVVSGTLLARAGAFKGQELIDAPSDKGTDVFFYVSGSVAAARSASALFGGHVIISGSMVQGNFGVSGGTTAQYSRAHGERTSATGPSSHAEGRFAVAQGSWSHAEGDSTFATGQASHAEGLDSATYANYSHAEGRSTEARGVYSHAEGYDSIPRADYSHAEGRDTETITGALYSHAEGSGSITLGEASHAGGLCTIASGSFQTVFGKYNLRNNVDSLFVIGNGTATSNDTRSDVIRVQPGTLGAGQLQVSGSMSVSGSYSGNTNTMSGPGTIGSAGHSMLLTCTGPSEAVTLADGTWPGQLKYVVANSGFSGAGLTSVITPTNALGYTSVTFDTNGEAVTFFWTGSKWVIVGSYGATINP